MFGSGPNMDEVITIQRKLQFRENHNSEEITIQRKSQFRENYHSPSTQVLFQLKFTSKQLEKMSKKAEKDQHKEEASIVFVKNTRNLKNVP